MELFTAPHTVTTTTAATASGDTPASATNDTAPIPTAPSSATPEERESSTAAHVPIETHFASREELLTYVHEFTVSHGYAVVIQKSNVPRGQVWLRCDLGGSYRNTLKLAPDARKRKCSSRLQNCPFQLYARRLPDSQWLLKIQNAHHNHDVAADPEQLVAHPVARRLTLAQKKLVDDLTEMGARPALIVEKMKQKFPDKPIKVQDIYNTRNYIRRERSAGRVPFPELEEATVLSSNANEKPQNEAHANGGATSTPATTRASESSEVAPSESTSKAPAMPSTTSSSAPSVSAGNKKSGATAMTIVTKKQLQKLLGETSDVFPSWHVRTQRQFLSQLESLLAKCKQQSSKSNGNSGSTTMGRHEPPRTRGRQQRMRPSEGDRAADPQTEGAASAPPPPPVSPPQDLGCSPPGSPLGVDANGLE
uniref:FAR1 domain-containing protein n=1 Tax=Globisporangium ultimum (strain ATCC 200006 / CBS 805.95 / DAOM BR144) TaxID=431595 RepID=K3WT68_GLOUD